jgi:hypothetical protein
VENAEEGELAADPPALAGPGEEVEEREGSVVVQ